MDDTAVIRTRSEDVTPDLPLMNYTAVCSHPAMAEAFVERIIKVANNMMSNHELTAYDLMKICQVCISRQEQGVSVEEGRNLRRRIREQINRADRYGEPFSMLVLRLDDISLESSYETVVDSICERVRQTDFLFLFKTRIVLMLPHTVKESREILKHRITQLLETSLAQESGVRFEQMTYPDPQFKKGSDVLDWSEDQLRT